MEKTSSWMEICGHRGQHVGRSEVRIGSLLPEVSPCGPFLQWERIRDLGLLWRDLAVFFPVQLYTTAAVLEPLS